MQIYIIYIHVYNSPRKKLGPWGVQFSGGIRFGSQKGINTNHLRSTTPTASVIHSKSLVGWFEPIRKVGKSMNDDGTCISQMWENKGEKETQLVHWFNYSDIYIWEYWSCSSRKNSSTSSSRNQPALQSSAKRPALSRHPGPTVLSTQRTQPLFIPAISFHLVFSWIWGSIFRTMPSHPNRGHGCFSGYIIYPSSNIQVNPQHFSLGMEDQFAELELPRFITTTTCLILMDQMQLPLPSQHLTAHKIHKIGSLWLQLKHEQTLCLRIILVALRAGNELHTFLCEARQILSLWAAERCLIILGRLTLTYKLDKALHEKSFVRAILMSKVPSVVN